MKGYINSYCHNEQKGTILSDDGESLHFTQSNIKSGTPFREARVEFEVKIRENVKTAADIYAEDIPLNPNVNKDMELSQLARFLVTEHSPRYEYVERVFNSHSTKYYKDKIIAKRELIKKAENMGCNCILNAEYDKRTRKNGNYKYSVYSLTADFAIISETSPYHSETQKRRVEGELRTAIVLAERKRHQSSVPEKNDKSNTNDDPIGFILGTIIVIFVLLFIMN